MHGDHAVEANTEDAGVRVGGCAGELGPVRDGPAQLRFGQALLFQHRLVVVDGDVAAGVNDIRQAEVFAFPLIACEDAGIEVVEVVRRIGVQEVIDFEIDALEEVNEDPAMVAVDQVLQGTRDEAGLGLGFDFAVNGVFDFDLDAGFVSEADSELLRHERAVACRRLDAKRDRFGSRHFIAGLGGCGRSGGCAGGQRGASSGHRHSFEECSSCEMLLRGHTVLLNGECDGKGPLPLPYMMYG